MDLFENKKEEAFSLKNRHLPSKLFRYRSFPPNVTGSINTINELLHKYVYLAIRRANGR